MALAPLARPLLLLLLAASACAQETWLINPLGYDRYTVTQNSNSPTTYDTNTTYVLYTIGDGTVSWYGQQPPNVTNSQASLQPPGTSYVYQVAPTVYSALVVTDRPAVQFYGGVANTPAWFVCNSTIFNGFTCVSGTQIIATFAAIGAENPDTASTITLPVSFTLDLTHPQVDALRISFVDLAMYRAQQLRNQWDGGQNSVQNNDDRISRAQIWGGGVMFLIAVSMEAVLVICVTLHAWTLYIRRFSKSTNFLVWLLGFFIMQQVVSIVGGFPGWLAMFIVLVLYIFILAIVYVCLRRKQLKLIATGGGVGNGQNGTAMHVYGGAGGVGDKSSVVVPANLNSNPSGIESGLPVSTFGQTPPKWTCRPEKMGSSQSILMIFLSGVVVMMMVTCLIVFYAWHPLDYVIWDRVSATSVIEFAPDTVGKSTLLMYMFPRMATIMQFNTFCVYSTAFCGYYFNRTLTSDDDKLTNIYDDFIGLYNIDMSDYVRTDYTQYTSVNDWFTRALRPGARPIASLSNPYIAVSPADCRMVAFENINSDLHVWLKGEEFQPYSLLNIPMAQGAAFVGGTMVVARLAPADYHRFHSPVTALLSTWTKVSNTIFSVNADGARSGNKVYFNTRQITILNSPQFGQVAYVAIGATCVGSVIVEFQNQQVQKGDELGIMQFGGSTVVLLFTPGAISVDNDILLNSRRGLETRVLMGERIGVASAMAM